MKSFSFILFAALLSVLPSVASAQTHCATMPDDGCKRYNVGLRVSGSDQAIETRGAGVIPVLFEGSLGHANKRGVTYSAQADLLGILPIPMAPGIGFRLEGGPELSRQLGNLSFLIDYSIAGLELNWFSARYGRISSRKSDLKGHFASAAWEGWGGTENGKWSYIVGAELGAAYGLNRPGEQRFASGKVEPLASGRAELNRAIGKHFAVGAGVRYDRLTNGVLPAAAAERLDETRSSGTTKASVKVTFAP
jgi:hypothetical protein